MQDLSGRSFNPWSIWSVGYRASGISVLLTIPITLRGTSTDKGERQTFHFWAVRERPLPSLRR